MTKPPFKPLEFAHAAVEVEEKDGALILRSPLPLGAHPRALGDVLIERAQLHPHRCFLAERSGAKGNKVQGDWRKVSYQEALDKAERIGAALLARGLSSEKPLAALAPNSIDHALLMLGAMHAGVPIASISVAYALMSQDYAKLHSILDQLQPGLVFAPGAPFIAALDALGFPKEKQLTLKGLAELTSAEKASKRPAVGPDTVAKILFTSGSTGQPKGVINTQRMLTSNQQAIAQLWPFLLRSPPVVLDWLPWSHTFGANHNFNMILMHGGTLYIDDGKPIPGAFSRSVNNLKEISPTLYFNVPRGFDMLLGHLEEDEALKASFFKNLQLIFYAGAALPESLWSRLERCSIEHQGARVIMLSAWGSTETAPMATTVHFEIERAGVIGLPAPGTEIKMVPSGQKMELRVKGPNVSPGYWRQPELTGQAFDEDGFFKMGDAGRFLDEQKPERGIVFDGRTAENFKLTSGTWVLVGALRTDIISACAPVVQDAVITGHDQDEVGVMLFLSEPGCRTLNEDEVQQIIRQGIERHNLKNAQNSRRVGRALILKVPPSIDRGEITDKGYINQQAVLENRRAEVKRLYEDAPLSF